MLRVFLCMALFLPGWYKQSIVGVIEYTWIICSSCKFFILCASMCLCVWLGQHYDLLALQLLNTSHLQVSTLTPTPAPPAGFHWVSCPFMKRTKRSRKSSRPMRKLLFRVDQAEVPIPSVLSTLPLLTSVLGVSREENIDYPGNNDQLAQLVLCLFSCPFPPRNSFVCLSDSCRSQKIFLCLAHDPKLTGQSSKEGKKQTLLKKKTNAKKQSRSQELFVFVLSWNYKHLLYIFYLQL